MPGSRRSRYLRSGERHRSSWEVGPETAAGGQPQQISSTSASLAATAVQATEDGQTLIRTRGELLIGLETATAAWDGFHGAFGIGKATAAAVLAGAASVPTPISEEAWDGWLYHRYFSIFSGGPIAVATAAQEANQHNPTMAAVRIEVDSKAMRKFDVDEALYAAIEMVEFGTGAVMRWTFNCRMLFKLMA